MSAQRSEWTWRGFSGARAAAAWPPAFGSEVPAIETASLTKRFGGQAAVSEVDLHVPQGAVYAFLGPNGAGKTTTIRMLLGLIRPSAGRVRIAGCDMASDRQGAARQIGALLEARATYDHMTGRENLDITRRLLGLPAGEADRALELVGLDAAAAGRRVGHYSLGMRQRLGLARALIGRPRVVLLDEPMNGLDPEGIAEMRRTIGALPAQSGVTVFLSSHLLDEVEQAATHIGLMRRGRLIAEGPLKALLGRTPPRLFVRTDDDARAASVLRDSGFDAEREADGVLATGPDLDTTQAARRILSAGLELYELALRRPDLEALYMAWTQPEAA
jgi:ABC-2 type transport system ATP-binding protein